MRRGVVGNTMYARNVVSDLKPPALSTLITSRVGTNSPKIDTIGIMEWYCVGSVTTRFIESINTKH